MAQGRQASAGRSSPDRSAVSSLPSKTAYTHTLLLSSNTTCHSSASRPLSLSLASCSRREVRGDVVALHDIKKMAHRVTRDKITTDRRPCSRITHTSARECPICFLANLAPVPAFRDSLPDSSCMVLSNPSDTPAAFDLDPRAPRPSPSCMTQWGRDALAERRQTGPGLGPSFVPRFVWLVMSDLQPHPVESSFSS